MKKYILLVVTFCAFLYTACELGGRVEWPYYTIVYNANGGNGTMENSRAAYATATSLNANTFTRTGYRFTGWAQSPSSEMQFTDRQSVNKLARESGATVTLYAVWEAIHYTVVYNANGGSGSMANSVFIYDEPQNLRPNAISNGENIFVGWALSPSGAVVYADQQSVENLTETDGATINLYAQWGSNTYTVIYLANGGIGAMEDSVFYIGVLHTLRENTFTREGHAFSGWATSADGAVVYADEREMIYLSPAMGGTVVTLYAKWEINFGTTLAENLAWLQLNAESDTTYILKVNNDESITTTTLSYSEKNNITIHLKGVGTMRTISLSENGSMFTITNGIILILENNITLRGHDSNTSPLIRINTGGKFNMVGGNIIDNNGGGVSVRNGGIFEMTSGNISGNISGSGGGVFVHEGNFTMLGGNISGNTANGTESGGGVGGGVFVYIEGVFEMKGGNISGNTSNLLNALSTFGGGGVFVYDGIINITGGTIYGYTNGNSNSNIVTLNGIIQNDRGSAVRTGFLNNKRRETTAGTNVNLFYDGSGSSPVFSGEWDN